jgi:hypothetical protein
MEDGLTLGFSSPCSHLSYPFDLRSLTILSVLATLRVSFYVPVAVLDASLISINLCLTFMTTVELVLILSSFS